MIAFLLAQTIAITGGTVYPVSGPKLTNATVLIRDGRIVAVGAGVATPSDATRIDAQGKWVTPGLIDGAGQVGLVEIGAVAGTREGAAPGRFQPGPDTAALGVRGGSGGVTPGAARPGAADRVRQPAERHRDRVAAGAGVPAEAGARWRAGGVADRRRDRPGGRACSGR